jgi:hypothetical protein
VNADYQPTMREIYDLVLSLKKVTELGLRAHYFEAIESKLASMEQTPERI